MHALLLHLSRPALRRRDAVSWLIGHLDGPRSRDDRAWAFAFKDAELEFARAVTLRANLWIWRVDQRAFAGDFLVVDLSPRRLDRRPILALDLKRGRPVVIDRPGVQMARTGLVVEGLVRSGVVADDTAPLYVTGDAWRIIAALGSLLDVARARLAA